jgi:hypothetical protein
VTSPATRYVEAGPATSPATRYTEVGPVTSPATRYAEVGPASPAARYAEVGPATSPAAPNAEGVTAEARTSKRISRGFSLVGVYRPIILILCVLGGYLKRTGGSKSLITLIM